MGTRRVTRLVAVGALLGAVSGCGGDPSPRPTGAAGDGRSQGVTDPPARRTFHKERSAPYRFENSLRGVAHAVDRGYDWIDVDSLYCWSDSRRSRVPIATHWPRIDHEGFDPEGRHAPGTLWSELMLSEVRALRTRDEPPYAVSTMEAMVRRAAALGMTGIEWEVKPGPAWEHPGIYGDVLRTAREVGLDINVKTVHGLGGREASLARLRAAKRAGATTMLINADDDPLRITAGTAAYVDFVRGPWQPA